MKILKKILLSSLSILGISFLSWTIFLLNPSLSYANQTQVGQITIHHNFQLETETEQVLRAAIDIISSSSIYDKDLNIEFCLNDDKLYPNLNPLAGATAYAFLNKTVIYHSKPNFEKNTAEFKWASNNYELRKYNLTILLAHEFMHNFQYNHNPKYQITSALGKINWKLEGHADYIARSFKNDGLLKEKIDKYLQEENKEHVGVPVFILEDGTIQNLSYFKYALVIQYLTEVKQLNYDQICEDQSSLDELYAEMLEWK